MEVTSELGPSKTQVGAADLTVKLAENRRPVSGSVELDNHGNRFSGEYRLSLSLTTGNLTGYGDLLSFRGFLSNDSLMKFGRLSYVIPVGPYGTRVGASGTAFEYELGKEFEATGSNGEGTVGTLYVLHPFVRTRNANLFVQAAVERKDLEDRIDAGPILQEHAITAGKLGVVGDFRDRLLSGGLNSYALTYTGGDVKLSPADFEANDRAPGTGANTQGNFSKLNIEFRRLQRLSDNFSLLFAYAAQLADKNLASAEKMSLGGPNGVRAYPVGEAPGDTGQLVTAELRYIIPALQVFGGDMTLSTFIDHGQVKSFEDPPPASAEASQNKRSISGAGIGLSLGREGNFLLRANVAWSLDKETPLSDTADRDPRVWIQAIKWF
jgi:hemolysin activation/secretion protein